MSIMVVCAAMSVMVVCAVDISYGCLYCTCQLWLFVLCILVMIARTAHVNYICLHVLNFNSMSIVFACTALVNYICLHVLNFNAMSIMFVYTVMSVIVVCTVHISHDCLYVLNLNVMSIVCLHPSRSSHVLCHFVTFSVLNVNGMLIMIACTVHVNYVCLYCTCELRLLARAQC